MFKLLANEEQALLVERNTFLVVDLGLHAVDGVIGRWSAGQKLNEDLHAIMEMGNCRTRQPDGHNGRYRDVTHQGLR